MTMRRQLSNAHQMKDEDLIAVISDIVYDRCVAKHFPAGDLEELRTCVDVLEYRHKSKMMRESDEP